MIFDQDAILADLPTDNNEAIVKIWENVCNRYADQTLREFSILSGKSWEFEEGFRKEILSVLLIYFDELKSFSEYPALRSDLVKLKPGIELEIEAKIKKINNKILNRKDQERLESLKADALDRIRTSRGQKAGFARFSAEEKNEIHGHISKIRDFISRSSIDDIKKDRLMSAVNNLTREVDLNGTWVDHFYVFMGRIGEALGEFGEKSAPLWDETRKMIDTVWGARRREDVIALPKPEIELLPPPESK